MEYGGAPGMDPNVNPEFARPTKVVHLRNLPFDVTVEEIKALCAPWGQVVAVKEKVGPHKNQAFIEFATVEQSAAAVSHFQSGVEQAQLRGRPTWLSYAGRDRITNLAPPSDDPSPVLHVTLAGVPAEHGAAVSPEVLQQTFAQYGGVRRVVVFARPEGGVLAWVQLQDVAAASAAKDALSGEPLPAIPALQPPPTLELAFCQQTELTLPNNSSATRDFEGSALPWGEPDLAYLSALLPGEGPSAPTNVLTVSFDKMTYPIALDGLHTIFSTYGFVQKIVIFEKDNKTGALVQYPDLRTADAAKTALEGHAMYDGGHNVMRLAYSKHRNLTVRPNERARDYTLASTLPAPLPPPPLVHAASVGPAAAGYAATAPQHGSMLAAAAPPAAAGYAAGPPAARRVDSHVHVTGDDYVRAHERVLEQYGVTTKRNSGPPPMGAYGSYGGGYPAAAPPGPAYAGAGFWGNAPSPYGYAPAAPPYGAPPPPPPPQHYGHNPAAPHYGGGGYAGGY